MRRLTRILALPGSERRLLAEAAATLALARALLALLPFATAMRLAGLRTRGVSIDPRATPAAPATVARAVGAAVARVAPHLPFRAVCLQQAMACTIMLRRRGLPVSVHFGLAKDAAGGLDAHAWSVSGGAVITGAPGRERFTPIAVFAA